jgi:hypothetical protein
MNILSSQRQIKEMGKEYGKKEERKFLRLPMGFSTDLVK